MMKIAWWKIVTIVLLFYTVIAGLFIPLVPSITGVSKYDLKENDQVDAYIYGGFPVTWKSNVTIKAWTVDGTHPRATQWIASAKQTDAQKLRLSFGESPYLNSTALHLVVQSGGFRDTLFNAFYFKTDTNATHGVLRVDKIEANPLDKSFGFPNREILNETVRNLFFHVPIWFAMMLAGFMGMLNAFFYLRKGHILNDIKAEKHMKTAVLMAILGLLTGSLWARFTWGTWWVFDVKLNGAAITALIYIAYLVLRSSINDEIQRARISGVYSIFAFVLMIVFVMIVPRIYDSLHPGNGGNPAFSNYDLDSTLRMVFYPAILAWMGLAVWITDLNIRLQRIVNKEHENI